MVVGVSRGGGGFLPSEDSLLQDGDYLAVMMAKDGLDTAGRSELAAPEHH